MSGLETAIRNALDRSDRTDRDTRARIYQSARQALDAGLQKQGISDRLIIMQQRELLERKIDEIEAEEAERVSAAVSPDIELGPAQDAAKPLAAAPPVVDVGHNVSRENAVPEISAETNAANGEAELVNVRSERREGSQAVSPEAVDRGKSSKNAKAKRGTSRGSLDTPPHRSAKPRRRRGFLSHLMTWIITLCLVGGACFWFYQSGMVQGFIDDAIQAGEQSFAGAGAAAFDPRKGFSDEWAEVFVPSKAAQLKAGSQARVETVSASEGQAALILSAQPGEAGDVAIEVPTEILREMAGKSSTIAITVQSGLNGPSQLAVRCDFGSLGSCNRHRFTATQEKQDALFRVSFDRSIAPNRPGRLIVNTGLAGPENPVLVYSVRILPGQ